MERQCLFVALLCLAAAAFGCEDEFVPPERDAGEELTGLGVGEECDADDNCRQGLSCTDGTCQPTGETTEGNPCFLTAECSDGLYCDKATGTCAPAGDAAEGGECGSTAACQKGLICQPKGFSGECVPAGEGDIGVECSAQTDCFAGLGCARDPMAGPDAPRTCLAGPAGLPRPFAGVECAESDADNFTAYFDVPDDDVTEFYRLPYPNDIRIEDGHPDLSGHPTPGDEVLGFDIVQRYIDAIEAQQDGFGLNQAAFLRFSQSPDFDTIQAGGDDPSIYIVDIDPDSPSYGRRLSMRWKASTGRGRYICQNWMAVRPAWGAPYRPETTYAIVLTTAIKSAEGGTAVSPDDDFEAMLAETKPDGLGAAWEAYAPLRDWMADKAVAASSLANAAVFTTGNPWSVSENLRTVARAQTPELSEVTRCEQGVTSPCDDGLDGEEHVRGCFDTSDSFDEIHAKISLPVFQAGDAPYLDEGGAMVTSGVAPEVQRREDVCLGMTVPKSTMPADGWPVLIFAHGTGGSYRSHVGNVADIVSEIDVDGESVGFLTVGWDQVLHFTRRGDSEEHPNGLVYNYANPDAAKGNFLQAAADIHAVVAWAENFEIAAADSPTGEAIEADPTQIYFMGHSQGGTSGPIALPFDSTVKASVLSGAGAGLVFALLGKTSPVDTPAAVKTVLMDPDVSSNHPVLNLLQGYFDPVDPLNYARYIGADVVTDVTTPSSVFHTFGVGDTYTPPDGLKTMARVLDATYVLPWEEEIKGVPTAMAPVSGNVMHDMQAFTVAGRQYSPMDYDGHFVGFRNSTARGDIAEFLGTAVTLGVPEIR